MNTDQMPILKVYELVPRQKHATVFEWFNVLKPGQAFAIKNDHDPMPLYYQMLAQLGPVFSWEYEEQGPEWWQVTITKNKADELSIGEIAAKDIRKAEAMKKMGVDFCCGGRKTIQQAAAEAGITADVLQQALQDAEQNAGPVTHRFDLWDADFLVDYILNQHHNYVYANWDIILQLTNKVKAVHSSDYPEVCELAELVQQLFAELKIHFQKEETVLFPYIRELAKSKREGACLVNKIRLSEGPLPVMLMEHEAAGDFLKAIRVNTNGYQIPDGACNSFRQLYLRLKELEGDLHRHIHLENNILFPKVLQLEKKDDPLGLF